MLRQIGLSSPEELFDSIPEELRLRGRLNTPAALSEIELLSGFSHYLAVRILHRLHALSTGDLAGHAANNL